MNRLFTFVFLGFSLFYCSAGAQNVKVEKGEVYFSDKIKDKNDITVITGYVKDLVDSTMKKDLSLLKTMVSSEKGVYLDVKGLWTYNDLLKELSKEDSYFSVYFFDHDKLVKEKKSDDVLTVREVLALSGGVEADLYFESKDSCEVRLRFNKNKRKEYDLNNPYFIKLNGKWYLYRLF
ncbi:MAG TPA: hypothetical protein PK453_03380 [Leptospiraceae bacterium]|nr:hypothetical protein [Leptospiraceae bacterium]HMY69009.1 hypothetical protein [Leptospiraceae bacterium]HNF12684.1 hypothetical protein [Leptospiraceae bacterium]HNF23227.1 hypothetical protein [Leptospiraceae bacterium]HNI24776.1 hypothetical protein [Leptospiraceae bacterium]